MKENAASYRNPGRRIEAHRCRAGHVFLYGHGVCPTCGQLLSRMFIPAAAVLTAYTTVRVNPSGVPIRLGIARTRCGASTLCIVKGAIRGNGRDRVMLVKMNGRFHALGRGTRLIADPRRFPNPRGY
jgi:uncharacterized OB-fold protein